MNKYELRQFINEPDAISDFINLPKCLYDKSHITQNIEEEYQLLTGSHIFSKYFELEKFLVYSSGECVARAIMTVYNNDKNVYVGFFECINDVKCAEVIFNAVRQRAKKLLKSKIIGPVNSSFWIGYRLKIDGFDKKPYFGEPNNLDYYQDLYIKNGFDVSERYSSKEYSIASSVRFAGSFKHSEKKKTERNKIIIKSPKQSEFSQALATMHSMLSELYKTFPVYKNVNKNDFVKYFSRYKAILDFSMAKFAYDDGKTVGFFIPFPDYGNLLSRPMTYRNKVRIMVRRLRSKKYVMLYIGVNKNYQKEGIAKSVIRLIVLKAFIRSASLIGALLHEDNVSNLLVKEKENFKSNYVLLERTVSDRV